MSQSPTQLSTQSRQRSSSATHGLHRTDVGSLYRTARRWLQHATSVSAFSAHYALRKAHDALFFSMKAPLRHRGLGFAVPTKLVDVAAHQDTIRSIQHADPLAVLELRLIRDGSVLRVAVFLGGQLLGFVQHKHAWLTPLVACGVRALLLKVTGDTSKGHTLGVNICLAGIDRALRRHRKQQQRTHQR